MSRTVIDLSFGRDEEHIKADLEKVFQLDINKVWAEAYTKQRPTPDMVMGGSGNSADHNPASAFMQLLTAKTAKDLQLDLSVQK